LLKKSLPTDFEKVKESLEAAIKILNIHKINITLWNFPLCYLDNPLMLKDGAMAERQNRRLIKIHKNAQMENAEIRDWEDYLKLHQECKNCRLKNFCSGIDPDYIKKYHFPKLKPLL
jgi:hypothetical protein